ncbi:SDR family oxidoreductase [Altericroceibacterium endophyticum]|uniref:NAD(P)H-binding protein n=1 Tax=Altericroceibacterium endophyticum TaxID=1808508 RepID=A0A6I4T4A3_9SPHN|nr:SDR family oxidoreductase [Altericroceibacterium endophyticum]MXO65179.1 NAD(P)H-binding protein [Altericroceibacterium endophyticum]
MPLYGVTGATGQLGQLVLDEMLTKVEPEDIVAFARDPGKLADYAAKGVTVRAADYDAPETLLTAFEGIDRLLLISGSALGERPRQHQAVIDAAKQTGVSYMAYTSILHADETPIKLGAEHRATEQSLAESGLTYDLLRNGWYNENYVRSLPQEIEAGVIAGAAGQGKISSASRADLAAGAAEVLVNGKGGDIYELAGDEAWTMDDLAAEVSRQSGKTVVYKNMSEEEFAKAVEAAGMPDFIAKVIANSNYSTSKNALYDNSRTLSTLTGRPTTPISETVAKALAN